jgi:hypothetical protein
MRRFLARTTRLSAEFCGRVCDTAWRREALIRRSRDWAVVWRLG